ncbi:MAG: hypothetical protein SGI74_01090 [Oligoflexia bacterium]|nr:hypothetical protein [Oligoflexia bacterium]
MNNAHFKDPLVQILERHLFRCGTDETRSSQMIQAVVDDYIQHLKDQGVHIPGPVKEIFMQDLKEEIREMTIKKTFGAVLPEKETANTFQKPSLKSGRKVA